MTTMVWMYLAYLGICVAIATWVARTLRQYGTVFITDGKNEPNPLVDAQTRLLIVGFNLIVLGATSYALKMGGEAVDARTAIEVLSTKVGGIVVVIGLMHFGMVGIFSGMRDTAIRRNAKLTVAQTVR